MNITFNNQTLQTIALFEKITHAKIKDMFETEHGLTFVVENEDLQKAIGKNAQTIGRIRTLLKKNIRLIGFTANVSDFIKNVARPVKLLDVQEQDGVYTMVAPDHKSRGFLLGRNAGILRHNESIIQRYFPIKELKVISGE